MTWPLSFATQTITRRRASTVDDTYGSTVLDWTSPDDLDITDVTVQPVYTDEAADGAARDVVQRRWLVVGPVDMDLTATDRVVFGGEVYQVAGAPARYETGILDHSEVYLIDFRG